MDEGAAGDDQPGADEAQEDRQRERALHQRPHSGPVRAARDGNAELAEQSREDGDAEDDEHERAAALRLQEAPLDDD